jgi:hypothetical protein
VKKYLFLAALVLCLGSLNIISTQAQVNNNTIYACYQKENGQLRKVGGPGQCKSSEVPINWNVAGVPGPQGPQGLQGPQGGQDEKGDPGPAASSFLTCNIKNLPPSEYK